MNSIFFFLTHLKRGMAFWLYRRANKKLTKLTQLAGFICDLFSIKNSLIATSSFWMLKVMNFARVNKEIKRMVDLGNSTNNGVI